jgi:hypothetical protein
MRLLLFEQQTRHVPVFSGIHPPDGFVAALHLIQRQHGAEDFSSRLSLRFGHGAVEL